MAKRLRYIFSDIDGVLTDGRVRIDTDGNESKEICYRDLDSIAIGHKAGLNFIFVTGEDTRLARQIAERFQVSSTVYGAKDKLQAVKGLLEKLNITKEEVCYIGDSNRDAPAIAYVAIGIAPQNGANKAKQAADIITEAVGGSGVLFEVVEKIVDDIAHGRK